MINCRKETVKLLCKTFSEESYSNILLYSVLSSAEMTLQDRKFMTTLYYGVLEKKITLDYIISLRVVDDIDEAISHINRYNTKHSEAIITESYNNANKFLEEIDAACVYVNASTRFTDGFEFGFGAEIGISTQKLHARGPMGLKELTTYKYIIYGNGQVRK